VRMDKMMLWYRCRGALLNLRNTISLQVLVSVIIITESVNGDIGHENLELIILTFTPTLGYQWYKCS
jgi:hypothetical protein